LTLLAPTVLLVVMLMIRIFALYEVLRCYDGFKSRLCMSFIFSLLVETCPAVTRCFLFFSSYGFLGYDLLVYGLYYLENPTFRFLLMSPNDANLISIAGYDGHLVLALGFVYLSTYIRVSVYDRSSIW
jgi:hypothetical protein